MAQLLRKWIQDSAVNSDKLDSSDSYTILSLQVTADATVGNNFQVDGTLKFTVNNYTNNATAITALGGIGYLYRNGDNLCITH